MSALQSWTWHLLWAAGTAGVGRFCYTLPSPLWRDGLFLGVIVTWVLATAFVWNRAGRIPSYLRKAEDMTVAERVDRATEVWDVMGRDNAGRRHRKRLFKPYLDDLGVSVRDDAVTKSKRRKDKKRRKRR